MMKNTFGVDFILAFQASIGGCLFAWGGVPSFDIKAFSLSCTNNLGGKILT